MSNVQKNKDDRNSKPENKVKKGALTPRSSVSSANLRLPTIGRPLPPSRPMTTPIKRKPMPKTPKSDVTIPTVTIPVIHRSESPQSEQKIKIEPEINASEINVAEISNAVSNVIENAQNSSIKDPLIKKEEVILPKNRPTSPRDKTEIIINGSLIDPDTIPSIDLDDTIRPASPTLEVKVPKKRSNIPRVMKEINDNSEIIEPAPAESKKDFNSSPLNKRKSPTTTRKESNRSPTTNRKTRSPNTERKRTIIQNNNNSTKYEDSSSTMYKQDGSAKRSTIVKQEIPIINKQDISSTINRQEFISSMNVPNIPNIVDMYDNTPINRNEIKHPSIKRDNNMNLNTNALKINESDSFMNRQNIPPFNRQEIPPPMTRHDIPSSISRQDHSSMNRQDIPPPVSRQDIPPSTSRQDYSSMNRQNIPPPVSRQDIPPPVSRQDNSSMNRQDIPSLMSRQDIPSPVSRQDIPSSVSRQDIPSPISRQDIPSSVSRQDIPSPISRQDIPLPMSKQNNVNLGENSLNESMHQISSPTTQSNSILIEEIPKVDTQIVENNVNNNLFQLPAPNVPDYSGLSEHEKQQHRATFQIRFGMLRSAWPTYNIPNFDENVPLEYIHAQYDIYVRQIYVCQEIDQFKVYLIIGWLCLEILCYKIGLDIGGYTVAQINSINKYDRLLIELGENGLKSTSVSAGRIQSEWPVEMRIIFISLVNAVAFICIKMLAGLMNGNEGTASIIINALTNGIFGQPTHPAQLLNSGQQVPIQPQNNPPVIGGQEMPQSGGNDMLPLLSGLAGLMGGGNGGGGNGLGALLGALGGLMNGGNNNNNNQQNGSQPPNRSSFAPAFNG